MDEIRLQKYLAEKGLASRRKCEELIKQGKVTLNGKTANIGDKLNPQKDVVLVDGKLIKSNYKKVYILLNKPVGYVTTVSDQFERATVMDLVDVEERVVPAGRLDMYTSGALILSNDGEFIYQITHPKHETKKTYVATVNGKVPNSDIAKLRSGIKIEDYITKPAIVKELEYNKQKDQTKIEITIHEGKNRQIRKMIEAIGKKTIKLERIKIGNIDIKDLEVGKWRFLKREEVDNLIH